MDKNLKISSVGITLCAVIFWSSAYPVNRYLVLMENNPYLIAFSRAAFTMVVFLVILLMRRKSPSHKNFQANWLILLGMALTGVVGMFITAAVGLQFVTAGKSTLINAINPALIIILAHFIFHEPLGSTRIIGLFLSLFGVFLVITGNNLEIWYRLSFHAADFIFVASGLCWALYSILNRLLGDSIDYMEGLFWIFLCGTILLLPLAIVYRAEFILFDKQSWLWMFYLGLVPGAFGNYLWYKGIMLIGTGNAGFINSFLPLCTITISFFTLGEVLTPIQLLGALVLTVGVWFGIYKVKSKNESIRWCPRYNKKDQHNIIKKVVDSGEEV